MTLTHSLYHAQIFVKTSITIWWSRSMLTTTVSPEACLRVKHFTAKQDNFYIMKWKYKAAIFVGHFSTSDASSLEFVRYINSVIIIIIIIIWLLAVYMCNVSPYMLAWCTWCLSVTLTHCAGPNWFNSPLQIALSFQRHVKNMASPVGSLCRECYIQVGYEKFTIFSQLIDVSDNVENVKHAESNTT